MKGFDMTARWTKVLACVWAALCLLSAQVFGEDWPQLGNNPQRWNYTPEKIEPPYRLAWHVNFQDFGFDYRIYPGIQVVVAGGKAYVGTKNRYFYALDAATGKTAWRFPLDGPVMGAAACTGGLAIVGCMDGSVYAINAETGRQAWRFRGGRSYGFSADVLLADGKVFIPDRGGVLYALDAKTGKKLWQYDAGAQVLHTPAYNEGRVYFGSEDGRVHAVSAADGKRIWLTEPLLTHTFFGTWPVVFRGKVLLRYHTTHKAVGSPPSAYTSPSWDKSLTVLDEDTGKETLFLPQITTGMGGPTKPPAITAGGKLVSEWNFKGEGKTRGTVLQDLDDPENVDRLLDHDKLDRPVKYPFGDGPRTPGFGSHQENFSMSVIGDVMVKVHYHGFAWGDPGSQMGAYHLKKRLWFTGRSGGFPEPVGGNREHNAQGGTSTACSAADGRIFHQHWNTVCCWVSAGSGARKRGGK